MLWILTSRRIKKIHSLQHTSSRWLFYCSLHKEYCRISSGLLEHVFAELQIPSTKTTEWQGKLLWNIDWAQCCRDAFKIIRGRGPCEEINMKGKWRKDRFLPTYHRSSVMSWCVNTLAGAPRIPLATKEHQATVTCLQLVEFYTRLRGMYLCPISILMVVTLARKLQSASHSNIP